MDAQIIPFEPPQRVTLDDGRILDTRQSAAVLLHVRDGLKGKALAKAAGYSSDQTLNGFLRSELGRLGVQAAAKLVLADAGAIGVKVALELAQKAKSEKVRLDAAMTLMDRAGLAAAEPRQGQQQQAKGGISISFVMQPKDDGLIDVSPGEG